MAMWNVSRRARERRIGPFVDIRYLVTDNVTDLVIVAPCRAHLLGDVQTIGQRECSKNGDKRGTRSGITSKQDGDTRVAWAWRVRDRRKIIKLIRALVITED